MPQTSPNSSSRSEWRTGARATHADEAFLLGDVLEQEMLHVLMRAVGVDRGDPFREVADIVDSAASPIRRAGGGRACPRSRPRSTDAPPNGAARWLPREPDGTHSWPWRPPWVGSAKIVYKICRNWSNSVHLVHRSRIVYKCHEIRGLHPGRRLPGREAHAFSRPRWLPLCAEAPDRQAGRFPVGHGRRLERRSACATRKARCGSCATPAGTRTCRWSATPSGNCESFRCRFHGWTYDLQGRFVSAPPPVAPPDRRQAPRSSPGVAAASMRLRPGLLQPRRASAGFFPPDARCRPTAARSSPTSPATGRSASSICWPSTGRREPDFAWHWPLLAVRRAGPVALIEQVVPHTFLRTRLLTHVFGAQPMSTSRPPPPSSTSASACRPSATRASRQPTARWWRVPPQLAAPTRRTARRPESAAVRSSGGRFFASHYVHS